MRPPLRHPVFLAAALLCVSTALRAQEAETAPARCDAGTDPRVAVLTSGGDTVQARALQDQWLNLPGRPVYVDAERAQLRMLNDRVVGRLMARRYPPALREAGRGGVVSLALQTDARGQVVSIVVLRGAGDARLDSATVEVARTMRFTPVIHDGCLVPALAVLPIRWETPPIRPEQP